MKNITSKDHERPKGVDELADTLNDQAGINLQAGTTVSLEKELDNLRSKEGRRRSRSRDRSLSPRSKALARA